MKVPIILYNTLTRTKQKFKPIKSLSSKLPVGIYTCGPTVYHFAHIGNLRSYIFADTLKRTLIFNDYKVKHVMNITDVGHLTSDADFGEDKMLKGAKREKKTVHEIAEFYTHSFQNDLQKLNILSPTIWCKATEHIPEQIHLIKRLEQKGYTYLNGGNVYFDTSKLADYGKLARLDLTAEKFCRVKKDPHKKNPCDFVLWFTKSKFKEQEMKWDSPWGKGYPGWHIECSAMSIKYLGEHFDLHTGGIDHIPVHHTNEIAQSEAATGKKPWVNFWMHNEFLILNHGKKMSKSGENFVTLNTLEQKSFSPLDYRYFCLGTHYRKPIMFSLEALENAKNTRKKLNDNILTLKCKTSKTTTPLLQRYLNQFTKEINDDLNTPQALATLWEVIKDNKLKNEQKYSLILEFDQVFGLKLNEIKEETIPKGIKTLAEERFEARKNKEWDKSDKLRDKINQLGYTIGDTKDGYEITKG